MNADLERWWSLRGRTSRKAFFFTGVGLFLVKFNLDRIVGASLGLKWEIWNYWDTDPIFGSLRKSVTGLTNENAALAFASVALPFIAVGIVLTVRRLRDAGLPVWFALFFFVPIANLTMFAWLSVQPPREPGGIPQFRWRHWAPGSALGAAAASVIVSVGVIVLGVIAGITLFSRLGLGLFLGVPFIAGFVTSFLLNLHRAEPLGKTLAMAWTAMLLAGVVLFGMAVEGVICLFMALPIALPLNMLGALVAHKVMPHGTGQTPQAANLLVCLVVPGLIGVDSGRPSQLFVVVTEQIIDAPPERVWQNVISFSRLPEPNEAMFKTGIAYPIEATIIRSGVGAVRYCTFSTGSFVEPITVWDAPRRLRFSVTQQPAVMHELSWKKELVPPHISDEYLRSVKGEFVLEPLPNGRTRLIGRTWYHLRFHPELYWRLWSDYIIHRIHGRVLRHIKDLSERPTP